MSVSGLGRWRSWPRVLGIGGMLGRAYDALGFADAAGGDEVFRALVLARIIEPTSKLDSLRVLAETGVDAPSYRTITRQLPNCSKPSWHPEISGACAAHAELGPGVAGALRRVTLYFETDQGDWIRVLGFSNASSNTSSAIASRYPDATESLRLPVAAAPGEPG